MKIEESFKDWLLENKYISAKEEIYFELTISEIEVLYLVYNSTLDQ